MSKRRAHCGLESPAPYPFAAWQCTRLESARIWCWACFRINESKQTVFKLSSLKSSDILWLRKRRLQLLPFLMRRQNKEAKAGAFAYVAGEFRCHSPASVTNL